MKRRPRIRYTESQKAPMWNRWQKGDSLQQIAQLFDRYHSSIERILVETGGIRPAPRYRSRLALTLAEREEISRALAAGQSIRSIATSLGRAPSTISREIKRNGGLLRQVLHNLISNAIKYNVPQGWIEISAAASARRTEVQVSNSSPGIPAAERNKIFERFYRADPAHGRQIDGVGLGLSVSREIAKAHGGDITLKNENGGAVRFVLSLPV